MCTNILLCEDGRFTYYYYLYQSDFGEVSVHCSRRLLPDEIFVCEHGNSEVTIFQLALADAAPYRCDDDDKRSLRLKHCEETTFVPHKPGCPKTPTTEVNFSIADSSLLGHDGQSGKGNCKNSNYRCSTYQRCLSGFETILYRNPKRFLMNENSFCKIFLTSRNNDHIDPIRSTQTTPSTVFSAITGGKLVIGFVFAFALAFNVARISSVLFAFHAL